MSMEPNSTGDQRPEALSRAVEAAPAWHIRSSPAGGVRVARLRGTAARATRTPGALRRAGGRSEEHTSELQSLMRTSYAVFCLKKKNLIHIYATSTQQP